MTTRTNVVLALIAMRGYKSYLEIGCDDDTTFSRVSIDKIGVDPMRGGTHRMTSDAFFAEALSKGQRFDIIFIDGDHRHGQAARDVQNALNVLELGGVIVMHDCLPPDERHEAPFLCGTAWRAFAQLRRRDDLDCVVCDFDYGVGIVKRGVNTAPVVGMPTLMDEMNYQQFMHYRTEWMRPITFNALESFMATTKAHGGTGVTSELSCRLHAAAEYHRIHGHLPETIDSSAQFWLYRDKPAQDVASLLLGPVQAGEVPRTDFDHGWCFGWCDEMGIDKGLGQMAQAACAPSEHVRTLSGYFKEIIGDRAVVVYRGNDKVKDAPLVDYETVVEMARDTGASRFLVQTDELDFLEHFRAHFPDTTHFVNFPMIRRNPNAYVLPPPGQRVQFAMEFFAAVIALGSACQLVIVTGNIGMWCTLFRGHTRDVWQADGKQKTWRRLWKDEEGVAPPPEKPKKSSRKKTK